MGLILLALAHAWSGHDLVHGHDHGQELGSAVYSTESPRGEIELLFQLSFVALVIFFIRTPQAHLPNIDKPTKAVDDDVGFPIFHPAISRFVPRPPPHSLLIA